MIQEMRKKGSESLASVKSVAISAMKSPAKTSENSAIVHFSGALAGGRSGL
ncbi:MAG: hypothetical protein L3J39_03000 [Verrucomicrobiales bacterium]|nr:hypothetical protein [Verrucomicrobiales bacterium]